MPVLMTPMSVRDDEDAAERHGEHREHERHAAVSPPIVPGSSVRSRLRQTSSGDRGHSVAALSRSAPESAMTNETTTMTSTESTNSPPIRAIVPRDMKLSNA